MSRRFLMFFVVFASIVPVFAQNSGAIFVVRHAERTSETEDSLSAAGLARAECLAATLRDTNIRTVISSPTNRTQSTALPTAKSHNVDVHPMKPDDFAAIATAALDGAKSGDVLIVGHSNTVPQIVAALKGGEVVVKATDYDWLFMVRDGHLTRLHYCPAQQPGPEVKMK